MRNLLSFNSTAAGLQPDNHLFPLLYCLDIGMDVFNFEFITYMPESQKTSTRWATKWGLIRSIFHLYNIVTSKFAYYT